MHSTYYMEIINFTGQITVMIAENEWPKICNFRKGYFRSGVSSALIP